MPRASHTFSNENGQLTSAETGSAAAAENPTGGGTDAAADNGFETSRGELADRAVD